MQSEKTYGAYVIETPRVTAGIAVREAAGYRLHVSDPSFSELGGHIYATLSAAQNAVDALERSRAPAVNANGLRRFASR